MTWTGQNMNVRQCANDFIWISALSTVSPQGEMCHMGLNMVELFTLVFPLSVLTPKNTDLREGGLANASIFRMPEHTLPCPFLLPPMAPNHPTTGSVSVPLVDPNRGPPSLDKGAHTGVSVPAGLVPPCSTHQVVQSSGQLMNTQIGSVLITSRLTAAQAEEIFLLTHEVADSMGEVGHRFH